MSTDHTKPFQFILYRDGHFKVNKKVSGILKRIREPLHIISVVGKYRTGKSYFMNRLFCVQSENDGGFQLGSTIRSETKGIWGWLRKIEGKQFLLIDTEGLYDPKTQGVNFDNKIISFALLLSSVFLLNTTGTIDRSSISQLEFVVHLTKSLKAFASSKSRISDYKVFFPDFIWLVRDFFLEMKDSDGMCLSDNQYLDEMIRIDPDDEESLDSGVQEMSRTKRYIKEMFPKRKCFTLVQPVQDPKNLHRIHELDYSELDPNFTKKMDRIVAYLHQNVQPKEMFGKKWTGRIFYEMTKVFIEHINSDKFLTMDTSFTSVVSRNNQKIEKEATKQYTDDMNGYLFGTPSSTSTTTHEKRNYKVFRSRTMIEQEMILEYLQEEEEEEETEGERKEEEEEEYGASAVNEAIGSGFPLDYIHELYPLHEKVFADCCEFLKKNVYGEESNPVEVLVKQFKDKIILYDPKIKVTSSNKRDPSLIIGGIFRTNYLEVNENKSEEKCIKHLKHQWKKRIDEKFEEFTKSGEKGYEKFLDAKDDIVKEYLAMKKMGPKQKPILKKFLKDKKQDEEKIKAMSTFILEKSKRIEQLEGEIDEKMDEIQGLQKKVKLDQKRLNEEKKQVEKEKEEMKKELERKEKELEQRMEKQRVDMEKQMEIQAKEAAARKKCGPCMIM